MERGPDPITHLALGKYARVGPGRGLVPPEAFGHRTRPSVAVSCRSCLLSIAGAEPPGYSTAFSAAELAAEKFSSWLVWYSSQAAESQISR